MKCVAALVAALILAATVPAQAYLMLEGPMPTLSGRKLPKAAPKSDGFDPAPRPNMDLQAPVTRERGGVSLVPGVVNRNSVPATTGNGYAPGSAFSNSLERARRSPTELGSTFAPALNLRVPLQ